MSNHMSLCMCVVQFTDISSLSSTRSFVYTNHTSLCPRGRRIVAIWTYQHSEVNQTDTGRHDSHREEAKASGEIYADKTRRGKLHGPSDNK